MTVNCGKQMIVLFIAGSFKYTRKLKNYHPHVLSYLFTTNYQSGGKFGFTESLTCKRNKQNNTTSKDQCKI